MKRNFLILLMALIGVSNAAFAQTESQIESDEVKRVGTHIACQCGACSENVNCNMSSGQCHFCKPARTQIYKLQKSGLDDSGVIASFVKQYGQAIYRADPNSFFWLIPYLSLAAGGLFLWLVMRKLRSGATLKHAADGPAIDDPILARYRDRIEKDTEKLD